MNKNSFLTSWIMFKPDICDYCKEKAEYVLWAAGPVRRKTRKLCEKHKQDWYNGTLNI